MEYVAAIVCEIGLMLIYSGGGHCRNFCLSQKLRAQREMRGRGKPVVGEAGEVRATRERRRKRSRPRIAQEVHDL
jgi:hypothetical protein